MVVLPDGAGSVGLSWRRRRAVELRVAANDLGAQLRASAERLDDFAAALAKQIDRNEGDCDDDGRQRPVAGR